MASEGLIPSSTPEQRIEQASEAIRHMAEDDFQPLYQHGTGGCIIWRKRLALRRFNLWLSLF